MFDILWGFYIMLDIFSKRILFSLSISVNLTMINKIKLKESWNWYLKSQTAPWPINWNCLQEVPYGLTVLLTFLISLFFGVLHGHLVGITLLRLDGRFYFRQLLHVNGMLLFFPPPIEYLRRSLHVSIVQLHFYDLIAVCN